MEKDNCVVIAGESFGQTTERSDEYSLYGIDSRTGNSFVPGLPFESCEVEAIFKW